MQGAFLEHLAQVIREAEPLSPTGHLFQKHSTKMGGVTADLQSTQK